MSEFEICHWKVWIARRVSLGTISTIKRSARSHDWWLFNNKVHGGLKSTQVNRSQSPGSCYTHELAGFRHSDTEWRKSPQLLKDKSKQQNVLHLCTDTPWSRIEFALKKEKTPISNSIVTKGRKLLAYFLIELVPKASLGCFNFCLEKTRSSVCHLHAESPMAVLGILKRVYLRPCYSIILKNGVLWFGGKPISSPCLFQPEKRTSLPLCHWILRPH